MLDGKIYFHINRFWFFNRSNLAYPSSPICQDVFSPYNYSLKLLTSQGYIAWKVSNYGVFSGPYFLVFRPNTGKYGPEETPYLDHFHAVNLIILFICKNFRVINSLLLTFTKFWSIRPLRCQLHTIMKVIIYFLYIIVICLFHDIIFPWFIYILTSKLLVFPFVCLFVCWI